MAYNFKSIADVDVINNPSDSTNVLIEEDGFIKRVPKSAVGETAENMISKIGAVEVAETVTDEANVLIEEDGAIKRVSKDKVVPANVVTSPATASVGQTIVVKAVDEAGKPTEWEAADMSGGGYDAVISIKGDQYMCSDIQLNEISADTTEILNVVQKITNNEPVNVIVKYNYTYGGNSYIVSTPVSLSCRAQGTADTSDNKLTVAIILYNYYYNAYSVVMHFNTIDGTCIDVSYKTFSLT